MSETFILLHILKMLSLLKLSQLHARGTKPMYGEMDIYRQNYLPFIYT